jgi:two-component system OmpR family response regulator
LLTGNVSSTELQQVYDAGADAYLAKPFQLADLSAYLRALLRRPALRNNKVLTLGNLSMNTESGRVTKNGQLIHLFPMEYKLLRFLMGHPNQVFNARAIFERVWQKNVGNMDDTVRTHVRTLRRKIDSKGCTSLITTLRGLGYKVENRFAAAKAANGFANSEMETKEVPGPNETEPN